MKPARSEQARFQKRNDFPCETANMHFCIMRLLSLFFSILTGTTAKVQYELQVAEPTTKVLQKLVGGKNSS